MSLREALARVWPFGKWDVGFIHSNQPGVEKFRYIPEIKEDTVDKYFKYKKSELIQDAWIQKIGGFFDGIRFRPRPRPRTTKQKSS
jgi:hypothetical protein